MTSKPEALNVYDPGLFFEFRDVSLKMPKKPLVLFFGRKTFSDNSKYLFLACVRQKPNFDVIWCTWDQQLHQTLQQHGLPSLLITEDFQTTVNVFFEAAAAVFCENSHTALQGVPVLRGCLAGAKKIQLWHGISVKRMDLMILHEMNMLDKSFRSNCVGTTGFDCMASSSSQLDRFWLNAFGAQHMLRVGQARNEVIVRESYVDEFIGAILSPKEEALFASNASKILVAPTWQRGQSPWISSEDFYAQLERLGHSHHLFFCVKQHPFAAVKSDKPQAKKDYKHVLFLEAGLDVYPWLNAFAALITDYSSIMFDFMLTNKPVLTYDIPRHERLSFEPDCSLVPDIAFNYEFDKASLESQLLLGMGTHPLAQAQKRMAEALYETDPAQSCNKLVAYLSQVTHDAINKVIHVEHI